MNERGYHSPLRKEMYAATRARIVRAAAAAERGALSFAEVARRAGVSERTVYRHFPTVAALDEALVQQLEADAGWPAGDLDAAALPELTRRAFAAFARHRGAAPAQSESGEVRQARAARRRQLAAALRPLSRALSRERAQAAVALVALVSSGEAYRQLVDAWGLDGKAAGQAAAWAVETLVGELARAGKKPSSPTGGGRQARGRRA